MTGIKYDAGKRRWDLLPWHAVEDIVVVLEYGAHKYGDDNWRRVPHARGRYFAAAMRHMIAWWCGQECDTETGCSHVAHAACCMLFLLEGGD